MGARGCAHAHSLPVHFPSPPWQVIVTGEANCRGFARLLVGRSAVLLTVDGTSRKRFFRRFMGVHKYVLSSPIELANRFLFGLYIYGARSEIERVKPYRGHFLTGVGFTLVICWPG
jgi:hypothetical protein